MAPDQVTAPRPARLHRTIVRPAIVVGRATDDDPAAAPRIFWGWRCSCGDYDFGTMSYRVASAGALRHRKRAGR